MTINGHDRKFYTFRPSKSVKQRFGTAQILPISWYWGSKNCKIFGQGLWFVEQPKVTFRKPTGASWILCYAISYESILLTLLIKLGTCFWSWSASYEDLGLKAMSIHMLLASFIFAICDFEHFFVVVSGTWKPRSVFTLLNCLIPYQKCERYLIGHARCLAKYEIRNNERKIGWLEFDRIGICQNSFLLKIGICQNWKLSELEFFKIGIFQNWNFSELEFFRIGNCQKQNCLNWNLSELEFVSISNYLIWGQKCYVKLTWCSIILNVFTKSLSFTKKIRFAYAGGTNWIVK